MAIPAKPTVEGLGIDTETLAWRSSGEGPTDGIEVAFIRARDEQWVLMRVSGDPSGRILVFSRYEWDCFLDGARSGEFDDAAG